MEKRVFAKFSKLPNVVGRVDYISNPKRQENLLAFYQTPEDPKHFWKSLSEESKELASYNKAQIEEHNRIENERFQKGEIKRRNLLKTVEAREMMLCLPNDIQGRYDLQELAEFIAADIKSRHGIECAVGIHLNKTKTNLHAHVILPERVELEQTKESVATRNTYFNAEGRRSNKKDCVDENGKLLPGCRLVRKGELLHQRRFSEKNPLFANKGFAYGEKLHFAKIFNQMSRNHWVVYNHYTNPHIRLYSLKREEPEALRAWKERKNSKIRAYNKTIDELIDKGEITKEQALEIKREFLSQEAIICRNKKEMHAKWQEFYLANRENYNKYLQYEKRYIKYDKNGRKRSMFELLVILGLTMAEVGRKNIENLEYNNDFGLRTKVIKTKNDKSIQKMIDDVYRAAGKKTPSEVATENRIKKLAYTDNRKVSLEECMAEADAICSEPKEKINNQHQER